MNKGPVAAANLAADWFAIPQITARTAGVNEDTVKSDAAAAVQSIPGYVEARRVGLAEGRSGGHMTQTWSPATWLSRGWCRAEWWCHLLSNKVDSSVILVYSAKEAEFMFPLNWQHHIVSRGNFTVESDREVVVRLSEKALESKIRFLHRPVGALAHAGAASAGKRTGDWSMYRYLLAQRPRLLAEETDEGEMRKGGTIAGFEMPNACCGGDAPRQEPVEAPSVEDFCEQFHFKNAQEAVSSPGPMTGMLCAIFAGDVPMVRRLVMQRSDVTNARVKDLGHLGFFDTQSLLISATKSNQNAKMLTTLIELRADVELRSRVGVNCAFVARAPEHVEVFLMLGRSWHSPCMPMGLTPLTGAVVWSSTETVMAMHLGDAGAQLLVGFFQKRRQGLEARCDPNPPHLGAGYGPLHGLTFLARSRLDSRKIAETLIAHRADVMPGGRDGTENTRAAPSGLVGFLSAASRLHAAAATWTLGEGGCGLEALRRLRECEEDRSAAAGFECWNRFYKNIDSHRLTALGCAAFVGDEQLARLFLEHGPVARSAQIFGKVIRANDRGDLPIDSAMLNGHVAWSRCQVPDSRQSEPRWESRPHRVFRAMRLLRHQAAPVPAPEGSGFSTMGFDRICGTCCAAESTEMTGTFGAASTALVHEMFFPMYVVKALVGVAQDEQVGTMLGVMIGSQALAKRTYGLDEWKILISGIDSVSDFLEMTGPPAAHAELQAKGLLHQWRPEMFVIFVSHQWLSFEHPDPKGEQASFLRAALRNVINGTTQVEMDMVTESGGPGFPCEGRRWIAGGYLFLDWFAIPQVTARAAGVNEDVVKSDAAKAVQSIPAYVEVANIFLGLVCPLQHYETGSICNFSSWLSRGWCRAELWCHVLSNKPDTRVIVIHSKLEVEFMFALNWQHNSISNGQFTVESDRAVVVQLGHLALQSKIQYLSQKGPLWAYRFYSALIPRLFKQETAAARSTSPQHFVELFRFPNFKAAVEDTSSMNGVLCALFAGDAEMLRLLGQQRADMNGRLHGLETLGYFDSQTPLMAALKSQQESEVISALLEMRANVDLKSRTYIKCTYLVRSPEHVKLLLAARADFQHSGPGNLTALTGAASWASASTVQSILDAGYSPNDTNAQANKVHIIGYTPLHGLAIHSRDNPEALESARILIESRADVNAQARPKGWLKVGIPLANLYSYFRPRSRRVQHLAYFPGITPLGITAWSGDQRLAELLLEYHADVSLTNDMGKTPEDLALELGQKHLLPLLPVGLSQNFGGREGGNQGRLKRGWEQVTTEA
ncbi:Receptor-interacting serine/threonine-protein kinase 4 (Ankyrin repeat domain-containing protein 3) (PKC-delta-interacting protein kinase) [Durusdinium trenchii]|uniref:Receptor-interacting serine/threonine-protein kinase 4 (Ankyrin repeat domain-containing protein 3) (PKC-delta-interacting protein kinase) n=1 Tax=Durusdinium trenchii TaxID=1381693 RepID=A0ABP0MIV9_9DINO